MQGRGSHWNSLQHRHSHSLMRYDPLPPGQECNIKNRQGRRGLSAGRRLKNQGNFFDYEEKKENRKKTLFMVPLKRRFQAARDSILLSPGLYTSHLFFIESFYDGI